MTKEIYDEYMRRGIPREGDVLFTTEGPLGEVALVPSGLKFSLAQRLIILRPNTEKLLPEFLQYLLLDRKVRIRYYALSTGTTLSGISSNWLTKLLLPYPKGLSEQLKIAIILSKVDELIQKTDQVIEQSQRLKKGLMQRLLTKGIGQFKKTSIAEIPESWEVSTIGKECKVGTGGTPSRTISDYFNGDIPWVKSTEVNFNWITSTEEHIAKKALEESARQNLS